MRAPIVVSSLLIAGALGKPIKRDYVYEDVTIWTTVTVYAANIATESIPTVTLSKTVGTTKTQTAIAIAIPTGEIPSSSAVHDRHHHKWNAYKAKPFAVSNNSSVPVLTFTSAPPTTTAAIPEIIPTVTLSKTVGTTKTQAAIAIAIPTGEVPSSSAVHDRHLHRWNAYKAKPFAVSNTSSVPVLTFTSAPPTTTAAIPTPKLNAFVTNSSLFKEEPSASTVASEEPKSASQVTTSSTEEASSASTPAPEESVSTPPVSTPTPETTSEPVNHSQEPTLEDAEIAESDGSPYSDGVHLLTTINKWRKIYKLPLLRWDHQLELNALKTGTDGAGYYQNHELNPGTMAQVITPGMVVKYGGDLGGDSPFELSYVAWLCESASDPELKSDGKDQCKLVDENLHMSYENKGHYEILTRESYTHIGCAFADNPNSGNDTPYQGLWVCDLS